MTTNFHSSPLYIFIKMYFYTYHSRNIAYLIYSTNKSYFYTVQSVEYTKCTWHGQSAVLMCLGLVLLE
jgi:hypothetical protein